MINYAHRGASEYAPENTFSSFYLGLLQGADGIETDVRLSRDGEAVLFHDDTLTRVCHCGGRIEEYTLSELKQIPVYGNSQTWFYDHIVTLREFLEHFAAYNIQLAIELKGAGAEQKVLELVREFGVKGRTTVTSFQFECLQKVKALDSGMRIGWLVSGDGCKQIGELKSIGGEEMAPEAEALTAESVQRLREAGLGVRAWGVASADLMKRMCGLGIDGMTVNFPDRLASFLNWHKEKVDAVFWD